MCAEILHKPCFYSVLVGLVVAVWRKQTGRGGKYQAVAVAFYRTSFEYEVKLAAVVAVE